MRAQAFGCAVELHELALHLEHRALEQLRVDRRSRVHRQPHRREIGGLGGRVVQDHLDHGRRQHEDRRPVASGSGPAACRARTSAGSRRSSRCRATGSAGWRPAGGSSASPSAAHRRRATETRAPGIRTGACSPGPGATSPTPLALRWYPTCTSAGRWRCGSCGQRRDRCAATSAHQAARPLSPARSNRRRRPCKLVGRL